MPKRSGICWRARSSNNGKKSKTRKERLAEATPQLLSWPLEDNSQDGVKAAIETLKYACNNLHHEMHLMETVVGSRAGGAQVHETTRTMNAMIKQTRQPDRQLLQLSGGTGEQGPMICGKTRDAQDRMERVLERHSKP